MHSNKDFFRAVLPSTGLPCIAWLVKRGNKKYFAHKVFDSIDGLCSTLSGIDFNSTDYYFAISSLKEKSIVVSGKKRIRVSQNMRHTRSFVLDVDIKEDNNRFYSNIDSALQGIDEICDALLIPSPIIVNSGFGLHVYWPMAGSVESAEWAAVARQFKRAVSAIAPKLVGDGTRVADVAGVLRVPGSFNHKTSPAKPVAILQWSDETLDFSELKTSLHRIHGGKTNGEKLVSINTSSSTPSEPVEFYDVVSKCNWLKQYTKNKGQASEPEWYAALGLVPYLKITKPDRTIKGEELAQLLSKGHTDYSEEATAYKYRQIVENQSGPTLCERLKSINPDWCKGCPFEKYVKTPIQVAKLDTPAKAPIKVTTTVKDEDGNTSSEEVTIPLPPAPYFRGESGGVYTRVREKGDDGQWAEKIKKVYDFDVYPIKRVRNETSENESMVTHLWLPMDGLREFKLPTSLLADAKALGKFIAQKGVIPPFGGLPLVVKYFVDYIRHLQMNESAETEFSRFGWRDINTAEPKFIVGDGYINTLGDLKSGSMPKHLNDASAAVKTQGKLDKWKKGFSLYETVPNSEPYILASMMGFAAPLLALTEYSGVLYNMVGHSGGGKSTALKVMASVWGKPTSNHILHTDTIISIFNMIGYLANVPVSFDEVTKMEGEHVSNFVLSFTSGRGKMRARRDGTNQENNIEWDTIVCSTSNVSLYDKLAQARKGYSAEAMRIFELSVGHSDPTYKTHIDAHTALLRDNYGVAGRKYIEYIIPRLPALRKKIEQVMLLLTQKAQLRNEERFWGALLACVYVGGIIAKDKLGLHNYDVKELVNWCLGTSDEVRDVIATTTSDAVSCLAEFLNNNLNAIVRINNNKVDLAAMHSNINSVRARLEYENGEPNVAYISIASIRKFCQQNNVDASWLRNELLANKILIKDNMQKRLATGTSLPNVNLRAWKIDLKHEALIKAIEPAP